MSYILVIWTMVARYSSAEHYDWRSIGEFKNSTACVHAARQLNVRSDRFRCLPTDTTKQEGK